jgi:hypothetical protein
MGAVLLAVAGSARSRASAQLKYHTAKKDGPIEHPQLNCCIHFGFQITGC